MSNRALQGLEGTETVFQALPSAAQGELRDLLVVLANNILYAQKRAVPVLANLVPHRKQGALKAGLQALVQLDKSRVRVGLLNVRSGRADLFYGRIVQGGRKAQTVIVQRRKRVNGKLRTSSRGSRKRASDIVATYSLNVRSRAPHNFIYQDAEQAAGLGQIDGFWVRVMERSGASA